jgi:hypothetical protein
MQEEQVVEYLKLNNQVLAFSSDELQDTEYLTSIAAGICTDARIVREAVSQFQSEMAVTV